MTNIDLKRLAVDADYWDECGAPEDATHFSPQKQDFDPCWMKFDGRWRAKPAESTRNTWGLDDSDDDPARYIPRPPKMAQEAEWADDGLPPVGAECRMTLGFVEYDHIKITYMGDGVFCYLNMSTELEYTGALFDATFRPLKSQHERQREELALCLQNDIEAITGNKFCDEDAELLADNLLFKGWSKEPKP